jgi:hypothetical protein
VGHYRDYKRRPPYRKPKTIIKIFCEGERTEPSYFSAVRSAFKKELDAKNIELKCDTEAGSDPKNIVDRACNAIKDDDADKAFCVFDHDGHNSQSLKNALDQIKNKRNVHDASSDPCFELWLLLHFCLYTAPCKCANVVNELKKKPMFNGYSKGTPEQMQSLMDRISIAIENARQLNISQQQASAVNPSTKVANIFVELGLKL